MLVAGPVLLTAEAIAELLLRRTCVKCFFRRKGNDLVADSLQSVSGVLCGEVGVLNGKTQNAFDLIIETAEQGEFF